MAEKSQSLSIVSGLSAALLVVATFNNELLEMTFFVKILISVLLFLMPLCLWFRTIELLMAEDENIKSMEEITHLNVKEMVRKRNEKRSPFWRTMDKILTYAPFAILFVFTIIVFAVIFLIFNQ